MHSRPTQYNIIPFNKETQNTRKNRVHNDIHFSSPISLQNIQLMELRISKDNSINYSFNTSTDNKIKWQYIH